jgi:hypothetical protein
VWPHAPAHTGCIRAARALSALLQTIHHLRYGCLPVFVIEGRTPPAKLQKLRDRCEPVSV